MTMIEITDPIERIVADALNAAHIPFTINDKGLDFYLNAADVWIECKQFHTTRTREQMSRVENIIVVQGRRAAEEFARMIAR